MTTATAARQDCLALPYVATTEAKANQFADALEEAFIYDIKTEVFEDGGKWHVAVVEGMDIAAAPFSVRLIDYIVILLMNFDFVKYPDDRPQTIEPAEGNLRKIPVVQKKLTKRARRAFRIEDKLDRILAALDSGKATAAGKSITVIQNDGTPVILLTEKIAVANPDGN